MKLKHQDKEKKSPPALFVAGVAGSRKQENTHFLTAWYRNNNNNKKKKESQKTTLSYQAPAQR
jgi:hypothetical protein